MPTSDPPVCSSFSSVLLLSSYSVFSFFFNDTATTEIYTLSLHDALPILLLGVGLVLASIHAPGTELVVIALSLSRSEEHTSELQSLRHLVCRLLLEKKKKT